jgi:hypothetical protein
VRLALTRVKRELLDQLAVAGVLERVGADHVFATIPTAVAAFHARREPPEEEIKENELTPPEARSG